jgi:hypothetical protein
MVGEPKPEHPLHPRRPPFNRRQLLMQVVVAGVILASGIGIGAGGTILVLKDRIVWKLPSRAPDPRPGPPRPPIDMVEQLRTQYNLTDEQVEKVKTLFAARLEATRARWKELNTAEQTEREKLVEDMKGILTPDQYEKWHADYQKMIDDMRNRPFWGPRGGHRGPPHGDRGPGPRMGPDGRRGDWPPGPPMGPENHRKGDRPPDQPAEFGVRPGDVNMPK